MAGDPAAGGQARSPEAVDRAMVAVCGAIWLVMLGMSVVATVALVQLGRGRDADPGGQSSWLLYSVIAVSALIIAGAIPLLLRARRTALADSGAGAESGSGASDSGPGAADPGPVLPIEAPTEKLRVFGTAVDPYAREAAPATVSRVPAAVVDRLWLRGTTSLLGAMGVALTAVAIATYLLTTGNTTGTWAALGTAAVITVAMPAILVAFTRRLSEATDAVEG
ncbi:Protein of unknown function DUF2561 [Mycobacteriaceae bacterium]